ncbi:MAG: RICIN domain-containing protein, partial [Bacteroidaceae bacterium]|nr:RICIN domain-containing protein [Bacteroidaceae bacterium]
MKLIRILFAYAFMVASLYAQALESGQTIRLVHNGLSIFVENSSLDENAKALLWTETNVNAQRWTLEERTNGTFLLSNDYTGFYLAGLTSGNSGNVGQIKKSSTNSK